MKKSRGIFTDNYTPDEEVMIKELSSELLQHGGTIEEVREQMECAGIPFFKELVKSILKIV